jgi:hypothetical protein
LIQREVERRMDGDVTIERTVNIEVAKAVALAASNDME